MLRLRRSEEKPPRVATMLLPERGDGNDAARVYHTCCRFGCLVGRFACAAVGPGTSHRRADGLSREKSVTYKRHLTTSDPPLRRLVVPVPRRGLCKRLYRVD